MNRLEQGDFYRTSSFEERQVLIHTIKANGISIGPNTWEERDRDDHMLYPLLKWGRNNSIIATSRGSRDGELTYVEFINKMGLGSPTHQGNSKLKHYFIKQ